MAIGHIFKESEPPLEGLAGTLEKLVGDVARLQSDYDNMRGLAGQIIATLRVNRLRGTIVAINPQGEQDNANLDEFIEAWSKRLTALDEGKEAR